MSLEILKDVEDFLTLFVTSVAGKGIHQKYVLLSGYEREVYMQVAYFSMMLWV